MTAKEKAEKMLDDFLDAYQASRATRGTWYLWQCRDKYAEVAAQLAKSFTDDLTT